MISTELSGPLLSGGLTLILAVAGWIWYLANKTSKIEYLDRRLTALELSNAARNMRIDDMADRLARLEPMISFLVEQLKSSTPA